MSTTFSQCGCMVPRYGRFRSPRRASKAVWNQPRKYFRSPAANQPYACRMSLPHYVFNPSWPPRRPTITTCEQRAESGTSNAHRGCESQHVASWGMEEGNPPPVFSANKTNNSVARRRQREGTPTQFAKVRMGTLEIWFEGGVRDFSKNNHARCRGRSSQRHKRTDVRTSPP
jgi:hypothetical protein